MTLREEFENEVKNEFGGVELLFELSSNTYVQWLESKVGDSKSIDNTDFYTEVMRLINTHVNKGLSKPDLVSKMEYATRSCILS